MKTAYLTFSHPALSQTFVVDEVRGLREMGLEVETWGIRPATPETLRTDVYREEAAATRTLRPLPWGATVRAHLRALRTAPIGYVRTGVRIARDRPPGSRALRLALSAFVAGIRMWDELDRRGIRHLHVHFAGSPTNVAVVVTDFGNHARRGGTAWTWSVSVHGPSDFMDLTTVRLRERVRKALFVVAISDFGRSQVLALLPSESWDKVRVVRCGIDTERFAAREPVEADGELRILYVGRLVAVKGQPVLLEALAGLGRRGVEARLTLVGEGPERASLERLAESLGVSDRVTFTGALSHDRVHEEYARANAFCLPSFAEGVPVVLMEAMAIGLPVVTTRIAGIPELVEDGVGGLLVRPGRADELEEALARISEDPELRTRLGEGGRAKVERDYSVAATAAQLAELHREFREGP